MLRYHSFTSADNYKLISPVVIYAQKGQENVKWYFSTEKFYYKEPKAWI